VVTLPLPESRLAEFDRVIWYEGIIESHPAAETTHAVDLYAGVAGVSVSDRRPVYVVTEAETLAAVTRFPRVKGKRRVGIQCFASAVNRCYPLPSTAEVARQLVSKGCEVFLFGAPGSVPGTGEVRHGVTNLTQIPNAPGLRESVAIASTCDVLLCPDSAMLHYAAALEVPTVTLFAAFDPALRVTSERCYVLRGRGDCVGCAFHSCGYERFPEGKPCYYQGICVPLSEIEPGRIVSKILQQIDTYNI